MNSQLLLDGLQLMVFGMGMVYVFLVIMIYCMKLLKVIVAPFAAKEAAAAAAAAEAAKKAKSSASGDDALLAAAAVAAVASRR